MFLGNRADKTVCTNPNKPGKPQNVQVDTSCPSHCIKDLPFKLGDFFIEKSTGKLKINTTSVIEQVCKYLLRDLSKVWHLILWLKAES